jgi:hypothetical protein
MTTTTPLQILQGILHTEDESKQNDRRIGPIKCKKIEITLCILSYDNSLKLGLNKIKSRKRTNNWGMNNTLLNDSGLQKK